MSNICVNGIPVEFITFSDGSENCRVPVDLNEVLTVSCDVEDCTRDIVRLLLVDDALCRIYFTPYPLFINYLPQARADRVFERGMALPKEVFAHLLDRMNFDAVYTQDVHSDVRNPLYIRNQPQYQLLDSSWFKSLIKNNEVVLCAPDKGAKDKCNKAALKFGLPMITGYKTRDVTTGQITGCGIEEQDSLEGKFVLMIDDISDNGTTFKFLAREIRKLNPDGVGLHVTHGIFAKGLDPFWEDLDMIECRNIICKYITREDIMNFNSKFLNKQLYKRNQL